MSVELFALAIAAKALICHDDLSKIVGTTIDGVIGNRADDLARHLSPSELVRNLAARMGEGSIPANHHAQQAGQTALRPVSAEDARDSVLRAAEPTRPLPTTPDGYLDQAACWRLYRELFHGRRALVLLDDAANDAQVEKLAPPTGCALLVTSRQRLRLRHALHLERLPPSEAAELLQRLAPRLTATQAQELAELCAGLPVALRIAGGYLNAHAATPAAEYLHALQTNRLRRLRDKALQNDSDTHHDVNLVFEHSYTQLDAAQQRAWTALSVMPASFDRAVGKALIAAVVTDTDGAADSNAGLSPPHRHSGTDAGIQAKDGNLPITQRLDSDNVATHSLPSMDAGFRPFGQVQDRHPCRNDEIKRIATVQQDDSYEPGDLLDSLEQLNLLDYNPSTQRFDWHDLLRDYAATKADPQLTQTAWDAHASHYAAVAQQSNALYLQGHDAMMQGLALFDHEHEQLEAAFAHLQTLPELAQTLLDLVDGVAYTGDLRFHPRQRIQWLEAQAQAARQTENREDEGSALGNLGIAYADLGEPRKAIKFYKQSIAIARDIGDRRGEGIALWDAAQDYEELGEREQAFPRAEQALAIFEAIEDPYAAQVRATLAQWRKP